MHISGTEPSSVIFSRKDSSKNLKVMPQTFQMKPKGMV